MNCKIENNELQIGINIFKLEILLFVTVFLIFCLSIRPFEMGMPSDTLDPGWALTMSYLSHGNFDFGNDVIFNLGPLGGLYAHFFIPNCNFLNILLSCLLIINCTFVVIQLFSQLSFKFKVICSILLFFSFLHGIYDTIFTGYCLLVYLWINNVFKNRMDQKRYLFYYFMLMISFSAFCFVKGTFLLVILSCSFILAIKSILEKNYKPLICFIVFFIFNICFLWMCCNQNILSIPGYFKNALAISSVYKEGMAINGPSKHVVLYIIFCLSIPCLFIRKNMSIGKFLDLCLLACALFLFFNHGFTRHDGHKYISSSFIYFAILYIFVIFNSESLKKLWIQFIIGFAAVIVIGQPWYLNRIDFNKFYNDFKQVVFNNDNLNDQYNNILSSIRDKYEVGCLKGTVDIYNFNNTVAIASSGVYKPRPVFQSYQAIGPFCADTNLNYLRNKGTDNILFRVETIDGRYPTLDDGESWPYIFENYDLSNILNSYLVLKKKSTNHEPKLSLVDNKALSFEEKFYIPDDGIYFAKVKIDKSLLGRIVSLFYKVQHVYAYVEFADGSLRRFLVPPKMMESGFYLSPFIEQNADLLQLYGVKDNSKAIKSIYFGTKKPGVFWKDSFSLELYKQDTLALSDEFVSNIYSSNELKDNFVEKSIDNFNGWVDIFNTSTYSTVNKSTLVCFVQGWFLHKELSLSDKNTRVLVFKNGSETRVFKVFGHDRMDVAQYFKDNDYLHSGYSTSLNLDNMKGHWSIHFGVISDNHLYVSQSFKDVEL